MWRAANHVPLDVKAFACYLPGHESGLLHKHSNYRPGRLIRLTETARRDLCIPPLPNFAITERPLR